MGELRSRDARRKGFDNTDHAPYQMRGEGLPSAGELRPRKARSQGRNDLICAPDPKNGTARPLMGEVQSCTKELNERTLPTSSEERRESTIR